MKRIGVTEFLWKQQLALGEVWAAEYELEKARKEFEYQWALIQINYYGPNWLTTGLVGGWDE